MKAMERTVLAVLWITTCTLAAKGAVFTVGGPGNFPQIGPAVAAAASGDVVVVNPGTYLPFTIQGKGITVQALMPGTVAVECNTLGVTVLVTNVPAGESTLLAGLTLESCFTSQAETTVALRILNHPGLMRVEGCVLEGTLEAVDSRVSLVGCSVTGLQPIFQIGVAGRHALDATGSTLSVHDTTLIAGAGGGSGTTFPPAQKGGDGARLTASSLFLVGCTLQGGAGGGAGSCLVSPAQGGNGLTLLQGSTCYAVAVSTTGGRGGSGAFPCFTPGPSGNDVLVDATSSLHPLPGVPRTLTVNSPQSVQGSAMLAFSGLPGDVVAFLIAAQPDQVFVPSAFGVLEVASPLVIVHGATSGSLQLNIPLAPLPAGLDSVLLYVQAAGQGPTGATFLSNATAFLALP